MKKKLLIVFTLSSVLAYSQNFSFAKYRTFINEAEYQQEYKNNYAEALKNYDYALNYANDDAKNSINYINIAICHLNMGDTAKAFESLTKSVQMGNVNIEEQEWLVNMFAKSDWDKFAKKLPQLEDEYFCSIKDKEGYIALLKLGEVDQVVRVELLNRFPENIANEILRISDSCNFVKLMSLVEKGMSPACFMIYHLYGENKKYFNNFDSILKAEVLIGKGDPNAYVQWYDRQRIYVNEQKTQLYGEWNDFNSDVLNPIEDIANVDKRRSEIGLCTLEHYILRRNKLYKRNIKFPDGYKPPQKQ